MGRILRHRIPAINASTAGKVRDASLHAGDLRGKRSNGTTPDRVVVFLWQYDNESQAWCEARAFDRPLRRFRTADGPSPSTNQFRTKAVARALLESDKGPLRPVQ
jgi:hypothetical protein